MWTGLCRLPSLLAGARFPQALRAVSVGMVIICLASCFYSQRGRDVYASAMVAAVGGGLEPIGSVRPGSVSALQSDYLDYYGIRLGDAACQFGTFESGGVRLAAQFYRVPGRGKGTVVFVHGYLDHSAWGRHLINHLLSEGYNVAVYDQPGHGLSGGRRISTNDFSIYENAFCDFLSVVSAELPAPYDVVAHSLGGAVAVDHLLVREGAPFRRLVLIAPMIRDTMPYHLKMVMHTLSPLVDYYPRIPENNSSDLEMKERVRADPLQPRFVSARWSRSFSRWGRQSWVKGAAPRAWSPLVLSAGIETVIDDTFSNGWIRRVFPNSRFVTVGGGRHQLLNESAPLREQVLEMISAELGR